MHSGNTKDLFDIFKKSFEMYNLKQTIQKLDTSPSVLLEMHEFFVQTALQSLHEPLVKCHVWKCMLTVC